MAKYNVYSKNLETTTLRNAQIVYMYHVLGKTPAEIQDYAWDLQRSTIASYCSKYAFLLDQAREWFEGPIQRSDAPEIEDPVAYIIEMFDNYGRFMYLKVGKTKNLTQRMNQIGHQYNTGRIEVKKVFKAYSENYAEIIESALREHYQQAKNSIFIKNDRFQNIRFSEADLEEDEDLQYFLSFCVNTLDN